MAKLFEITGDSFFKPLTSQYKSVYFDCLKIIYDAYRTELSYGIERETIIANLTRYFEDSDLIEVKFEEDEGDGSMESAASARDKAAMFLRKLREFGWLEQEVGNDQSIRLIMPNHAVSLLETLISVERQDETEYQSELSAIYSLLTNEELLNRPYPQVIKPVYERTLALFTALKKLNTGIKNYIESITADKSAEQIIDEFFRYHDEIGSKAYHRIKTSDNIARFRRTIRNRLKAILKDEKLMEAAAAGYQNVEDESDPDTAREQVVHIITDVLDHFQSYDDIVREIDQKHSKYIRNAVERAKFLLLNTNDAEGRISTILQFMAEEFGREEKFNPSEDIPEEYCLLVNIFPQGFLSGESVKTQPISRKIRDAEELSAALTLSEEERLERRRLLSEQQKNRFSRKNINEFVLKLLENTDKVNASDISVKSRRDAVRIVFINLYGRTGRSSFMVTPREEDIVSNGFRFRDFEISRRSR